MAKRTLQSQNKCDVSFILNDVERMRQSPKELDSLSEVMGSSSPRSSARQAADIAKERIFECGACERAFRAKGDLAKHHKNIHLGLKPHECHYGMRFGEKGNLTKHMKRHEGDREFHCSFSGCKKTFVLRDGLRRHEKAIHGKEDHFRTRGRRSARESPIVQRTSSKHPSSLDHWK